MRRILIIFAKLNPGIRYVQGMNEVLAPLYYVFNTDPDLESSVSTFIFLNNFIGSTCSLTKCRHLQF